MIDPETETLLTIREAARLPQFRRDGRSIHHSTVWRWLASHRLESVRVGGTTLTSREAIQRMLAAQNPGAIPQVSPRQRERDITAAEKRLAACGI